MSSVVITGAASGIGLALSRVYLEKGWKVANLDLKESEIPEVKNYRTDVSKVEELLGAKDQIVRDLGRPEVWINNAGIVHLEKFQSVSEETFRKVMEVNFWGVLHGTNIALNLMQNPVSGKIVNVSSLAGSIPSPFMSSYVASKFAVNGFTRSIREELKQLQIPIQILLVSPAFVKTPIMEGKNGFQFPDKLSFMIQDVKKTAREIFAGIEKGTEEILPSVSAKLMIGANRAAPSWMLKGSRALTARNWKELFGLEQIDK